MELEREIRAIINGATGNHRREVERLFANARKVGMEGEALQQYRAGTPINKITDALLKMAGQGITRDSVMNEESLRNVSDEQLVQGLCNPSSLNLN